MSNRVNNFRIINCPKDKENELMTELVNLVHTCYLKDTTVIQALSNKFKSNEGKMVVMLDTDYYEYKWCNKEP